MPEGAGRRKRGSRRGGYSGGSSDRGQSNSTGDGPDEQQRALAYALRLLGYRQRSEKELRQRLLKKGFGPAAAEKAVIRLRDSGYIDDRAMAGSLRLRAEQGKLLGLMGARQYLRRMGISDDDADGALDGYDEAESASRLAEKKMGLLSGCPAPLARQRLAGYLRRRGFSYETVRKTIDAFIKEDHR